MSELGLSDDNPRSSTINLVRSTHPWTEANSAAGFVLRYLSPMRRQLTALMGSTEQADEALKLLLGHLVNAGFGEHKKGRLRDFLVRALRSAAKSQLAEIPEAARPTVDFSTLAGDSKQWLLFWREGLLERAWRSLEREEHANPTVPVYSILHAATMHPTASPVALVRIIEAETGVMTDAKTVEDILPTARAQFAQLIADEIAETLERPSGDDVKQEIVNLGLGKAFSGVNVVASS